MVETHPIGDLAAWLRDKPREWLQVIAVRAALRAFPFLTLANNDWLARHALLPLRANAVSWAACSIAGSDIAAAAAAAHAYAYRFAPDHAGDVFGVPATAEAAYAAAASVAGTPFADAAYTADAAYHASEGASDAVDAFGAIDHDRNWLTKHENSIDGAAHLSGLSLWGNQPSLPFDTAWKELRQRLLSIDASYSVWIEWFERRIAGYRSAFYIPGDDVGAEDNKIMIRLSAAGDDFWDKGAVYVNTTLQGWIDEARTRVAPSPDETLPEAPAQDRSAVVYGVNSEGKVDRLPTSNQQNLRDESDQRQIYADVREAFDELRAEGQRLGETLSNAVDRIMRSMPEAFEDAQAYLVWRDGNRLRRLYLAHRAIAQSIDPDPARLEPAIAEQLAEALDRFNLFASNDEGLRAKDEATVPFQERANAETEAALAKPVVAAMLDTPTIFTDAALGDLQASVEDDDLPSDDPYSAQMQVQANATRRNIIASVIAFGRAHCGTLALAGAGAVATGFLDEAGGTIFTDLMGTTQVYTPIMNFIVANAPAIKAYAVTAYSNGAVGVIVDAIVHRYKSID